jgi:hypothetical protein
MDRSADHILACRVFVHAPAASTMPVMYAALFGCHYRGFAFDNEDDCRVNRLRIAGEQIQT